MASTRAPTLVRKMSRWINVLLVYVLLGAVLLILTRLLLPTIGLGGIAGELIHPLAKLTPILLATSLAAITLITFNLIRQTRRAKKWIEEAENWGDDFITGYEVEPAELKPELKPDLKTASLKIENIPERSINYQTDERNGGSNGRGLGRQPAFTATSEGESRGMAAAAASAVMEKTRGERRPVTAEVVRDLSEDRQQEKRK